MTMDIFQDIEFIGKREDFSLRRLAVVQARLLSALADDVAESGATVNPHTVKTEIMEAGEDNLYARVGFLAFVPKEEQDATAESEH